MKEEIKEKRGPIILKIVYMVAFEIFLQHLNQLSKLTQSWLWTCGQVGATKSLALISCAIAKPLFISPHVKWLNKKKKSNCFDDGLWSGGCFLLRINPRLLLEWLFVAARQCLRHWILINYCVSYWNVSPIAAVRLSDIWTAGGGGGGCGPEEEDMSDTRWIVLCGMHSMLAWLFSFFSFFKPYLKKKKTFSLFY